MTHMTEEDVFNAFFEFFNWVYRVELTQEHCRSIAWEIRAGWDNPDTSEKELVAYVLQLHEMIRGASIYNSERLIKQAKAIMKKEFEDLQDNDRSAVLRVLHQAIEELRPMVTGVRVAPTQPSPSALPISPNQQQVPPTQPPAGTQGGAYTASTNPQAFYPQTGTQGSQPHAVQSFDPHRIQLDAYRENEMNVLKTNLEAMKHQTNMAIIGNIR